MSDQSVDANTETPKTIVSSWNEWDPLKHVIVGRADGGCIPAPEPALDAKVPEDSDMRGQYGPRPQETVDRANELLANLKSLLKMLTLSISRPIWTARGKQLHGIYKSC